MTLVEQTQQNILKYISDHSSDNKVLTELDFVDMFGVSRVVVREAVSRLRALGVIETRRKSGIRICSPDVFGVVKTVIDAGALSKETMKDLFEFRLMLEVGATDFIFKRKTPERIAKLEKIVGTELEHSLKLINSKGNEADIESARIILDADFEFHKTLMEMTGNKSLIDFQKILASLFRIYTPTVRKDYLTKDIINHSSLLKILKNGSPDEFRMAMHLHLSPLLKEEDRMLENL